MEVDPLDTLVETALAHVDTIIKPLHVAQALFHYTDARGFCGVIGKGEVWATDYRFLNDAQELVIGEQAAETVAAIMAEEQNRPEVSKLLLGLLLSNYRDNSLTKAQTRIYVAAFAEDGGNQLSQWRAYASHGSGYSIGFTDLIDPKTSTTGGRSVSLLKCTYREDEYRERVWKTLDVIVRDFQDYSSGPIRGELERARKNRDITPGTLAHKFCNRFLMAAFRALGVLSTQLKDAAFIDEKEWRLLVVPDNSEDGSIVNFHESARGLVPYIPISLKQPSGVMALDRVFVGPTQDPTRGLATAELFLAKAGYTLTSVFPSKVPFRG